MRPDYVVPRRDSVTHHSGSRDRLGRKAGVGSLPITKGSSRVYSLADGQAVIDQARAARAESQRLRVDRVELGIEFVERRGRRPITGGSDTTALVDLVMSRPICLPCLARKTGLATERMTAILTELLRSFSTLVVEDGACEECFERTIVHRLT